jgi:hypothetical protein
MNSLLTKLADELLVQDITEPSAVLGSLSDRSHWCRPPFRRLAEVSRHTGATGLRKWQLFSNSSRMTHPDQMA